MRPNARTDTSRQQKRNAARRATTKPYRRGIAIGGPSPPKAQMKIRLDPGLIEQIRKFAIQHGTSINKEVARRIEDSLK
jgi:predicted HicB family RNase H-like nuclease